MDSAVGQAPESTAEDLRREARRKKILQTAKARLDKLNGLARAAEVNYVDSPATEELDYSDPEVEPSVPIITTFAQQDRIFYSATNVSPNNADVPNKFVTGRVHIFIASILGYILSHYVKNSLFVPVFLCILIEIFYLKGHQNPQNNILALILPVALLFTGAFVGNKIRQINRLLSILQSLIINLAVNIFCICLSSFLFKLKSVSHVADIK
ncbi:uncharacterized protein LOC115759998 [Drosophila novamexicana]|uniref:uncharacterized protein LOC115759998 n=1 Tax=Drosophila novamexicana TaxID=47314 RepID=UPI0011E5C6E1|nr:uncharacterized protein LOC115759998 [Drosophila novamexicana]